jgi:hypothetical protein
MDDILDALFEGIDFSQIFESDLEETDQIGMWVPVTYKHRYVVIQRKSNKKFGKLLQEIVKRAIDKVDPPTAA